ncbi:hypothetical protein NC652_023118 [Populus alba x Populus x berolinensis]|nr:hypothetical protein NC652_023118 [Populus alba x Populus x berolinensis]
MSCSHDKNLNLFVLITRNSLSISPLVPKKPHYPPKKSPPIIKEKNGMLDLLSSVWLEEYYHSGNRGERLGDGPPRGPSVVCEAFHIISAQAHLPFEVIAWACMLLEQSSRVWPP